jgi:hypothetical protein
MIDKNFKSSNKNNDLKGTLTVQIQTNLLQSINPPKTE